MKTSLSSILLRIALPVLIGLGVTVWLFADEFGGKAFDGIDWNIQMLVGFALACVFVVGRDFGLTWRFHTIAHPQLTWRRSVRVDLMCAFTSAITPSAVGGSALAVFYLNREGVSLGKAATLTLTTLLMDEMFFVVFCPVILLLIPNDLLFAQGTVDAGFMLGVRIVFWIVYAGIVVYTALLFMGIIAWPEAVARFIKKAFGRRILRRWRRSAYEMANNMVTTSRQLRQRSMRWWLNVFFATVVSWFSRYLVVNALFWGFCPDASGWLVFGRQFVIWVLLMVSPTPGGSGISEVIFATYYGDLVGSAQMALVMALAWRLISYYIYLVAGSLILPSYFGKKKMRPSGETIP